MANRLTTIIASVLIALAVHDVDGQTLPIGIIDVYGLRRVSESQVRSALTIKEGDTVAITDDEPAFVAESERRLSMLPGVKSAHLFVRLRSSPIWTDRNKASYALLNLSGSRDPKLLAALHKDALVPLVEMARWKSEGHAMPALMILGRIAGQSDEHIRAASARGDRDAIINAALHRR